MIRTAQATINGRTVTLQFPDAPLMEVVIREVLGGTAYPFLPFLQMGASTILDVGANIGCASAWFASLYPTATVYAFEPASEAYRFLAMNSAQFGNVRCFPFGLSDRDGVARLHHGQADGGVTSSLGQSVLATASSEEVRLRRASAVIQELDLKRISLLKLDTEGAEVPILEDLRPVLDRVDVIAVEYHSERDRRTIDRLLESRFLLFSGRAEHPHRGTFVYAAAGVVRARTDFGKYEIQRPNAT